MTTQNKETRVEISLKYISPALVEQARRTYALYSPSIAESIAGHLEYVLEGCTNTKLLDYLQQPAVVQGINMAKSELGSEQFGEYLNRIFSPNYEEMRTRDLEDTIHCAKMAGKSPLEIFTTVVNATAKTSQ